MTLQMVYWFRRSGKASKFLLMVYFFLSSAFALAATRAYQSEWTLENFFADPKTGLVLVFTQDRENPAEMSVLLGNLATSDTLYQLNTKTLGGKFGAGQFEHHLQAPGSPGRADVSIIVSPRAGAWLGGISSPPNYTLGPSQLNSTHPFFESVREKIKTNRIRILPQSEKTIEAEVLLTQILLQGLRPAGIREAGTGLIHSSYRNSQGYEFIFINSRAHDFKAIFGVDKHDLIIFGKDGVYYELPRRGLSGTLSNGLFGLNYLFYFTDSFGNELGEIAVETDNQELILRKGADQLGRLFEIEDRKISSDVFKFDQRKRRAQKGNLARANPEPLRRLTLDIWQPTDLRFNRLSEGDEKELERKLIDADLPVTLVSRNYRKPLHLLRVPKSETYVYVDRALHSATEDLWRVRFLEDGKVREDVIIDLDHVPDGGTKALELKSGWVIFIPTELGAVWPDYIEKHIADFPNTDLSPLRERDYLANSMPIMLKGRGSKRELVPLIPVEIDYQTLVKLGVPEGEFIVHANCSDKLATSQLHHESHAKTLPWRSKPR